MKTLNVLNKIAYRVNINQVFTDFLNMVVAAFSRGADEKRYNEAAKNYTEEERKMFSKALATLIQDYDSKSSKDGDWTDIIGHIFEEVNSTHTASKNGQFFTPPSICNLMAEMMRDKQGENVNDPSCGSSRNLIAHSRLNPNNRFEYFYTGMDLDLRCCLMSVINFLMYGIKGVIIHCDTLKLEIYRGWRIYLPESGLFVQPLTADQCRPFLFKKKEEPIILNEQLKLF